MTTKPKPITRAALTRRVAQQSVWCVVSRWTGDVMGFYATREAARRGRYGASTTVIRAELRVKGVRA